MASVSLVSSPPAPVLDKNMTDSELAGDERSSNILNAIFNTLICAIQCCGSTCLCNCLLQTFPRFLPLYIFFLHAFFGCISVQAAYIFPSSIRWFIIIFIRGGRPHRPVVTAAGIHRAVVAICRILCKWRKRPAPPILISHSPWRSPELTAQKWFIRGWHLFLQGPGLCPYLLFVTRRMVMVMNHLHII